MSVGRSVGRSVCLSVTHSFDDPHVAPIGLLGLVFSGLGARISAHVRRMMTTSYTICASVGDFGKITKFANCVHMFLSTQSVDKTP